MHNEILSVKNLNAWFGAKQAVQDISVSIEKNKVTSKRKLEIDAVY